MYIYIYIYIYKGNLIYIYIKIFNIKRNFPERSQSFSSV